MKRVAKNRPLSAHHGVINGVVNLYIKFGCSLCMCVCNNASKSDMLSRMNEIGLKRFDVPKLSHVVSKMLS